ncbi:alpha/beta fold hydrolase [Bradyrhizobium guangzhouense]|uniref:Alpha/beta hydrolase n=1 Tax=Bradyrhizobium guangzhouense TaxID=1325095 RepID=A0AAE5WWF9_9BRAD|nr:alpha/beta hydrolase [Bradyrhizobium guangzhouense]QAU44353.1 alpha/beta hydrolase [Bradyrhizobium guangzhouense]RXH09342.1 alpha/beta hydrolase [Bradyrhizobium guangzhouense]RXH10076.1 alpha/beta hydrolase [Bradyrhizobium guangzhouense]
MQQTSSMANASNFPRTAAMPAPLPGRRIELADRHTGQIVLYGEPATSSGATPPLLLVHSVNAAATAYEMKPLFEHYHGQRAVYALDLPGFGLSDRSDRKYAPRLMTDAIHAAVDAIRQAHGDGPIDIAALSLGCEFAARAATETPNAVRSLTLISPTGFDRRSAQAAAKAGGDGTRAMPWLHGLLSVPLWKRGFFSALTSRASIRFFLQKTWGAKDIDEGLLEYDYITTHQSGAENAPYYFVSGYLFSTDAMKLYQSLSMPVWMSHGVRGDFVDYEQKVKVEGLPNWKISVFPTGAMPHFERPTEFVAQYEKFLNGLAAR